MRFRAVMGLAAVLGLAAPVAAEPSTIITTAPAPAEPRRHAVYLELLGKGGLWGVGYDFALGPKLAIGATASFYLVDDERITTFSPYLAVYPLGSARHRWFVHGGPQVMHLARPSPVPEWPGTSDVGVGAELSSGYELRSQVLFRAFAMGAVGKGGIAPWLGMSLGVTL